ncbi:hypothetical protein TWF569_006476 [Orbilia oligospora]|nr:hypothetical protein TWF569_006476 [Orbilia oligospora]KAF3170121.1 hypothetical protein TWF751_006937 [Orbilia oligospora]KAF3239853.1 hypothetical protein TWF217_001175 [Orbilia oligospora]
MYWPTTAWTRAFMALVLLEAAIVLTFECYIFGRFQATIPNGVRNDQGIVTDNRRPITTYLTLFIFAWLFQFVLVYDALRLKNTIQVFGLCIFNALMLLYSAIQIDQIREAVETASGGNTPDNPNNYDPKRLWRVIYPFLIAIPVVIGVITAFMSFVAWKLHDEFAWTIYKHISADLRMKRRYLIFQIYIALLKFDFFFFLGFTIQFLVILLTKNDIEFILTIVVIPVTILILLAASWFTRRENKIGATFVIILYFGGLSYFLFKLVRMYHGDKVSFYLIARRSLTIFAIITVILLIITIGVAIQCMLNFDKGLKQHVNRRKPTDPEDKHQMQDFNSGTNQINPPPRMEID